MLDGPLGLWLITCAVGAMVLIEDYIQRRKKR